MGILLLDKAENRKGATSSPIDQPGGIQTCTQSTKDLKLDEEDRGSKLKERKKCQVHEESYVTDAKRIMSADQKKQIHTELTELMEKHPTIKTIIRQLTQLASKTLCAASIIVLMIACYHTASALENSCELGTYKLTSGFSEDHRCVECPEGTFMPQENHQYTKCFNCTKIEDPTLEVLISPCTKSRDADIQCVDGYYRIPVRGPDSPPVCKKCDPCHELLHEIRRCQNYSNTWCCPDVNYDYEYDKHGTALCRERLWMCRKGQYMDTSLNDCKPCPDGTFMSVDYHSYTECWDCQYHSDADLPLHTELTQECNSTQPAIYSCKEGYYTNHSLSYRGDDIGCAPCKSCNKRMFVGRQCDTFHDTVCCNSPDMEVVDGPGGVKCLEDEKDTTPTADDGRQASWGKVLKTDTDSENYGTDYDSVYHILTLLVGTTLAFIFIIALAIILWNKRERMPCKTKINYRRCADGTS